MSSYFNDDHFQRTLLSLIVKDSEFLNACGRLLSANDFRVGNNNNNYVVAKLGLEYWKKYRSPIGRMLNAELIGYCRKTNAEGKRRDELLEFGQKLVKKKVVAVDSITDKLIEFKREVAKAKAIQEIVDLQTTGELTDEKWIEIARSAIEVHDTTPLYVADYFKEYKTRIDRRKVESDDRFPLLLLDPLDVQVRAIARGHVGLLIAPWKRGKSLGLIHIALAYTLQRYNVLYVTLEDPVHDVEDRFDAAVTHLRLKNLAKMPRTFRERFKRFSRLCRARIKIVDGTDRGLTVGDIEQIWLDQRNQGFLADAIIIDYDDELKAKKRNQERRFEFAEIYRDLRQLASRRNVLLWTAAQTRKGTESMKILSADTLAEDISKVRKVSFALSLGQGDGGEHNIYLYVAAHKFDRQHVGADIITNKERMVFFDRIKTRKFLADQSEKKKHKAADDIDEEL